MDRGHTPKDMRREYKRRKNILLKNLSRAIKKISSPIYSISQDWNGIQPTTLYQMSKVLKLEYPALVEPNQSNVWTHFVLSLT